MTDYRHHHLARHLRRSATATMSAPTSNPTIEPFTHALNGVDTQLDWFLQKALWWSLGIVALCVLLFRIVALVRNHLRHMSAMSKSKSQQAYFAQNSSTWYPKVKKNLLMAPLFNKRHNREIRLSSAINMGTIPGRLDAIILGLYLLSNFIYIVILDYKILNKFQVLAELRGRSGVLAVVNMIALVLLAGRNNPLIWILKVSFDTYNLYHRWMGRMVVVEAIIHTLSWLFTELAASKWTGIVHKISSDPFLGWGTVATCSMTLILFTSPSAIRHAFYETFLSLHILFAFLAIVGIWVHCDLASLPQLPYIVIVFNIWLGDRLARLTRIIWYNYSRKGWTSATVEPLPGEACRVTLHLPHHVTIKPGSHAYLRFAALKPWESHPFSIGWTQDVPLPGALPEYEKNISSSSSSVTSAATAPTTTATAYHRANTSTSVSFIIHAQTGLTRHLFNRASTHSGISPYRLTAAFEGPYGGHDSLSSYGTALLFAGSSGITHHLPYLRYLLREIPLGTVATRRITLVWIVRELSHLEWVRPWMDEILRMEGRREILTIKLFVTRPKSAREVVSPSATVQMFPGRPNVELLVKDEVAQRVGAMWVGVCGPGSLADGVRDAVREVQCEGVVDFGEESFTW